MKYDLYIFIRALCQCIKHAFRKKIFLLCEPYHPNLGDQAQLMCTEDWIRTNYPEYHLIHVGIICTPFNNNLIGSILNLMLWRFVMLKIFVRKHDIMLGHSGYFFVDHHSGWFSFAFIEKHFPKNKFIILPQTVNFYTPYVKWYASKAFSNKKNVTILCRDEVSYINASEMFKETKLLLYPDIVTSLIGSKSFESPRDGVLFCIRDDVEAYYSKEDIKNLLERFGCIRKMTIDTTVKNISARKLLKERDRLVWSMIKLMSTFKVVITDRYHGTIFSAIANTPVVVVSSADHKLSSGVKWFPEEIYGRNICFAKSLDMAYDLAKERLQWDSIPTNSPYFKEKYWDILYTLL